MVVEPVPDLPAAVVDCGDERALVVADFHAGIEVGLRREGVELDSRADERREQLLALVDRTTPDQLVVLGDLGHAIGTPWDDERDEIADLLAAVTEHVPVTLVRGNHDGDIETQIEHADDARLVPGHGMRIGSVGFAHGHTWPSPDVLDAEILCTAHEHPVVKLEDEVGGGRVERVWLRGDCNPEPFEAFHDRDTATPDELVVFPAFNDLSGGTWVNVASQEFLSPFLPDGLADGQAYLLDGTRLGRYDTV
ncbi:metallophosphoesterase [Salinibaculum rarum]|uniref:metallophosphoesterase n=1 Tax=Salinibaculum rarum TaxID=3058903 RepID=UPI00265E5150|nr:metallophosphoesterase [Salinibaculum sp. KK48]